MTDMLRGRGGFITMVVSILGLVLYVTMFDNILAALEAIRTYAYISTFLALETTVKIAPTILLLTGVIGAGIAYGIGYKSLSNSGKDANGLIRMVFGILVIILFVTLFLTVLSSFYTLYSAGNASQYIAFQTVVTILPTILFLSGLFAGGTTAVGGYKARKKAQATALA